MNHSISIIDHKQITDEHFGVLTQCCGDPKTNSWLTMRVPVINDPVQLQGAIDFHCNRVATNHEAALNAATVFPALIGTTVQITVNPAPTQSAPDPAPTTIQ